MTEYRQRLLRMIEHTEKRLILLRSRKESYIPALLAECERELEALKEALSKEEQE